KRLAPEATRFPQDVLARPPRHWTPVSPPSLVTRNRVRFEIGRPIERRSWLFGCDSVARDG
ncbi:MAG TPA: hypothetical protein VFI22_09790, partial [Thermomicrobiales bacterium]|nr:hypothetical protein [Thermomicrobiales bacterium]